MIEVVPAETVGKKRLYQLKIVLKQSDPVIWRRVQVASDITFAELHKVIQAAMGWHECQLHEFCRGKLHIGMLLPDDEGYVDDEKAIKLHAVIMKRGEKFRYTYDFADVWVHDIALEKIGELEPGVRYPVCLAGERACPPENSGGLEGYYDKLDILKNSEHPAHAETREWMGDYDPEFFDIDEANKYLSVLRKAGA